MNLSMIQIPRWVKRIGLVGLVLLGVRLFLRPEKKVDFREKQETAQVDLAGWLQMEEPMRMAFHRAEQKALAYAAQELRVWTTELKQRAEDDFFPWYFAYWNQQALALKTMGWHLMETPLAQGFFGRQPSALQKTEKLIEEAFLTRVLHPSNAQQKIDALTRETVRIYLHALSEEMEAQKAVYGLRDQPWARYIDGVSGMLRAVEGNRQVPLVLKGATAASGVIAVTITRNIAAQIKLFLARRAAREMMEQSMMYGARQAGRGYGWLGFTAVTVWDVYDHHRTVSQNLPVMRRLVYGCLDGLESQVMNDPRSGIVQTLEEVRRGIIKAGGKP